MMKKPTLLAIDTSSPSCSVAITQGDAESGSISGSLLLGGLTHSRRLLQSVDTLMNELELGWDSVDGIAVGLGPGSFTGLRIGITTAKGLAKATGLPVVGCSALRMVATGVNPADGKKVCAVLDARKKEVYACRYLLQNGELVAESDKMVLAPEILAQQLTDDFLLVGDGAALYRSIFTEILGEKVRFAPAWCNQPDAAVLGFIAARRLLAGDIADSSELTPFYVRKSDAELSLAKKKETN